MTIVVDMGEGRLVEFPDEETANSFFAQQRNQQAAPAPEPTEGRTLGQTIFENVVGSGEIDTPGERLGAGIRDVIQSGSAGVSRGVTGLLDLPGALFEAGGSAAATGLEAGAEALGIEAPELFEATRQTFRDLPLRGGVAAEAAEAATGGASEFRGETTPGQFAGTVGEFLPGALLGGGGAARNLLQFGVVPGLASEAAGQATEGTEFEGAARLGAALAAPAAVSGLRGAAQRIVSPGAGAEPARLAAARNLEREGVRVTAGQATGNEQQLFREAATTAGRKIAEEQAEQFTAAVLRRVGSDAKRATPEVINDAARKIGSVFDDVATGINVVPDSQLLSKTSTALQEFRQLSPRAARPPIIGNIHAKLTAAFRNSEPVTSKQILNWRSALSKLTRSPDAAVKEAAISTLDAIDDAVAQSLTKAGRGGDVEKLSQARNQWRNLIAVENAVARAGEAAATGIITPANLRTSIAAQGRRAFARGQGDLNELARSGVAVMQPLPQSGTQPRTLARELTAGAQGGTAAGLGSFALGADPATAAAVGATAVLAPRARNAFLASPAGQAFMRNQLLQPGTSPVGRGGQVSGLLSSGLLGN